MPIFPRFIFAWYLIAGSMAFGGLLSAAETVTITGNVLLPGGAPAADAIVRLSPGGHADTTAVDGSFRIGPVPDAAYEIDVTHPHGLYRRYHAAISPGSGPVTVVLEYRAYTVDELVVVAPLDALSPEKMPAGISVIGRGEFGQSVSVADAVKSAPGARITSMGGVGAYSELSLRGSNPNQVQVYLDGMPLNDAVGGAADLGNIPLAGVECIEVWRSGSPARFGGNATGGAISIVTRQPERTYTAFSAGYGSYGMMNATGIVSVAQENAQYMASAEYLAADNNYWYESDNGTALNPDDDYRARRRNNAYRSGNLLLKYRRLLGDDILLELSNHLVSSRRELPALQHSGVSSASMDNTRNYLQAGMTVSPDAFPWLETAPALQYQYSHERYRDSDGEIGWGRQDNTYITRRAGALVPTGLASEWGMLTVTPMIDRETYRPHNRLQETIPLSCDRNHAALVADAVLTPFGPLVTMTGTLRRDRNDSSYDGSTNQVTPVTPEPARHYFTNKEAAIRVQPAERLSLRAVWGDAWREPGFYELFGDRGVTVAKPGLKPERTIRREIAARFQWDGIVPRIGGFAECALFTGDYRNMIQWYVNSYGFVEPDNVTAATVDGAELIWRIEIGDSFRTTGTWTFQRSEVTDAPRSYHRGKELPGRPRQHGAIRVEAPWNRFTLFCQLDRKGRYYLDRANQEHKRYPGRSIFDAGCTALFAEYGCSVTLGIANLTDEYTFDYQGMPKPGRTYTLTIDCTVDGAPGK